MYSLQKVNESLEKWFCQKKRIVKEEERIVEGQKDARKDNVSIIESAGVFRKTILGEGIQCTEKETKFIKVKKETINFLEFRRIIITHSIAIAIIITTINHRLIK